MCSASSDFELESVDDEAVEPDASSATVSDLLAKEERKRPTGNKAAKNSETSMRIAIGSLQAQKQMAASAAERNEIMSMQNDIAIFALDRESEASVEFFDLHRRIALAKARQKLKLLEKIEEAE